jgi:hypothetical protein
VQWVLSATGPFPPGDENTDTQARSAAAWRAAADIELAYPDRDADLRIYVLLDQRAKDALAQLVIRIKLGGESIVADDAGVGEPVWSALDPPRWADRDPDNAVRERLTWPPNPYVRP